jgi:tetratricopeptide (TPR) repeat protein
VDWGWSASQEIAEAFEPGWVGEIVSPTEYLRLGFALYDMKRYDDALDVFTRFLGWGQEEGEVEYAALASIWRGHMLDLLGHRSEALAVYQEVADLNLDDAWSHGQYGLRYALSPWAAQRLETPFQRIENGQG